MVTNDPFPSNVAQGTGVGPILRVRRILGWICVLVSVSAVIEASLAMAYGHYVASQKRGSRMDQVEVNAILNCGDISLIIAVLAGLGSAALTSSWRTWCLFIFAVLMYLVCTTIPVSWLRL